MTGTRVALRVLIMFVLSVLQVTVLNRIGFPLAPPDVVVMGVVCFALADGPAVGAGCGFFAGLICDAMAIHPMGRLALILCLIGYAAGLLRFEAIRSRMWAMLMMGGAAAIAVLSYAALATFGGDPDVTARVVGKHMVGAFLWTLLLSPFVLPPVVAVARRVRPGRFA
jgi:rod shape-determining protein MreD